jgi:hypothetical protein
MGFFLYGDNGDGYVGIMRSYCVCGLENFDGQCYRECFMSR